MSAIKWTPLDQAVEDMAEYRAMAGFRKGRPADTGIPPERWGEYAFRMWRYYNTKVVSRVDE